MIEFDYVPSSVTLKEFLKEQTWDKYFIPFIIIQSDTLVGMYKVFFSFGKIEKSKQFNSPVIPLSLSIKEDKVFLYNKPIFFLTPFIESKIFLTCVLNKLGINENYDHNNLFIKSNIKFNIHFLSLDKDYDDFTFDNTFIKYLKDTCPSYFYEQLKLYLNNNIEILYPTLFLKTPTPFIIFRGGIWKLKIPYKGKKKKSDNLVKFLDPYRVKDKIMKEYLFTYEYAKHGLPISLCLNKIQFTGNDANTKEMFKHQFFFKQELLEMVNYYFNENSLN